MKKVSLIIALLWITVVGCAQIRNLDAKRLNIREKIHSGSVDLIEEHPDSADQWKYMNMADPYDDLDGVNFRSLRWYANSLLDTVYLVGEDTIIIPPPDTLYSDYESKWLRSGDIIYFPEPDSMFNAQTEIWISNGDTIYIPSDSIFDEFEGTWLSINDTIAADDSVVYMRRNTDCPGCFFFKTRLETDWSYFCEENGYSNLLIHENAADVLKIVIQGAGNDSLAFHDSLDYRTGTPEFEKYKVLMKTATGYNWTRNLILTDGFTGLGYGAQSSGVDSVLIATDPDQYLIYPNYDSAFYNNSIAIGLAAQATKDNQAVIGNTDLDELKTWGNMLAKGYELQLTDSTQDTLYVQHLILEQADSGKFAMNFGDSVSWVTLPVDSIYSINEAKWIKGNDTILIDTYWHQRDLNNHYLIGDTTYLYNDNSAFRSIMFSDTTREARVQLMFVADDNKAGYFNIYTSRTDGYLHNRMNISDSLIQFYDRVNIVSENGAYIGETKPVIITNNINDNLGVISFVTASDTAIVLNGGSVRVKEPLIANADTVRSMANKAFWQGTQAEYDAIDPKDANTIYYIEQEGAWYLFILLIMIALGSKGQSNWAGVYSGSTEINKIYSGDKLVWQKAEADTFTTVTIGTQTWMKYNLYIDDGGGGIYSYNDEPDSSAIYGYLYTWDAAMRLDTAIEGYHLPTEAEYDTLISYLGGSGVAGGKMKMTTERFWQSPNTGADNSSGFSALGAGSYDLPTFSSIRQYAYFWNSTMIDYGSPFGRYVNAKYLSYNNDNFSVYETSLDIENTPHYSVRLIKDD